MSHCFCYSIPRAVTPQLYPCKPSCRYNKTFAEKFFFFCLCVVFHKNKKILFLFLHTGYRGFCPDAYILIGNNCTFKCIPNGCCLFIVWINVPIFFSCTYSKLMKKLHGILLSKSGKNFRNFFRIFPPITFQILFDIRQITFSISSHKYFFSYPISAINE